MRADVPANHRFVRFFTVDYFAVSPTAYVNAPYAYCLRRFGMRRYCR
jgi:hypothetical protein